MPKVNELNVGELKLIARKQTIEIHEVLQRSSLVVADAIAAKVCGDDEQYEAVLEHITELHKTAPSALIELYMGELVNMLQEWELTAAAHMALAAEAA